MLKSKFQIVNFHPLFTVPKKRCCISPIAYNNDAYNCSLIVSLVILSLALNYMDTCS
ncbi:MAG: hypothetical protein LBT10_08530 [Methanobrevibacter sp.]|nr:hypothetical protein [Methanobrevibacter sp.]